MSPFIPNNHIIQRDRNRHGDGLLLYISNDIPSTCLCRHSPLELLVVELKLKQGLLTLVLYYRPPSSASNFDDLEDAILCLTPAQLKNCVLLGDFNVDLSCISQMSIDLIAMLSSFYFTQLVNEPTRVARSSSTTIDHMYLTTTLLLSSWSTCPPLGSSDLCADWDTICSDLADLASLPSPTDDVDSSGVSWKFHFIRTLSRYIPTKVCKLKKSLP